MGFANVYADDKRAQAYARLEFPGTYYLAFRDLPDLCRRHVAGFQALDFGCGAGRSARFLRRLGFQVIGVDIAAAMIDQARLRDPDGDYRLVADGELGGLPDGAFDLILAAFTFDNVPETAHKRRLLQALAAKQRPTGRLFILVSTPAIYRHEWASFTTRDFPQNRLARDGNKVQIVMTDVADRRPVEDILCTDRTYRRLFREAGLELITAHRPLGREHEPWPWKSEIEIAPWCIYVLSGSSAQTRRDAQGVRGWQRESPGLI